MIVMKSMQTKPMPLFHEEKIYSQLNCVPPQFTQGADQLYDCQNYPFVRPPPLELHWKCWKCRCNNVFTLRYILYFFLVFTCWFQIYVKFSCFGSSWMFDFLLHRNDASWKLNVYIIIVFYIGWYPWLNWPVISLQPYPVLIPTDSIKPAEVTDHTSCRAGWIRYRPAVGLAKVIY